MVLTAERAQILGDYLVSDTERAKKLVELTVDEAVKIINADGHDFTVEELKDFGEAANKAAEMQTEDGELSEEVLGEVSGGCIDCVVRAIVHLLVGITRKMRW